MTQRERFYINTLQRDALNTYCIFCNSINEVPRLEVTTLIMGCTETKSLKESIELFKQKTGKPKTE